MKNELNARRILFTGAILSAFLFLVFSQSADAALRAGVSKVNITKDKPSGLVNDPLYTRILVLDDGKSKAIVITMDIINIGMAELSQIRTRIQAELGINDLELMDADNKRDMEKYLNCIYKMEELLVTEANLGYLKNSKPQNPVKAEIMGLKVGDFVLITFSGEVFSQIGLNIKKASPYENTFVSGYTNGSVGYSPTIDAYNGDAYEVSLSKLAPEWQKIFEDKALEILEKL